MIDSFANYTDNWDGEDAKGIAPATISNCKEISRVMTFANEYFDDIFPTELGTLCMQWYNSKNEAMVNAEVSASRIAFYLDVPDVNFEEVRPVAFSKESLDKLSLFLKQI